MHAGTHQDGMTVYCMHERAELQTLNPRDSGPHMWFSTASTMTRCCCDGSGTCMRRAPPMAGCGTSPSPPISLEVSTCVLRGAQQLSGLQCSRHCFSHMRNQQIRILDRFSANRGCSR
jgi:hypothetical protein